MRINPTNSGPGVSTLEEKNLGRIAQIIGPVLDVANSHFLFIELTDQLAIGHLFSIR